MFGERGAGSAFPCFLQPGWTPQQSGDITPVTISKISTSLTYALARFSTLPA